MAGVSGVRGIVGPGMNPETALRYASAFASRLGGGIVVVGRDTRPSGPALAEAVFSALRFAGCSVVDLGIAATPTVEIMVDELGADGGIIITASHNGIEWNALKFLDRRGEFLSAAEMDELASASQGTPLFGERRSFGKLAAGEGANEVHTRRILALDRIERDRIAAPDSFWEAVYDDPEFRERLRRRVLDDCASGAVERMHWDDVPLTRGGKEIARISARNVPVPGKPMIHDCAITEHYVVVFDLPCTFDVQAAMNGPFPYVWNPDYGARRCLPFPNILPNRYSQF